MCRSNTGGDSPYAVLDKLVPGYYHRRTEQGAICASCCCNNTATEHAMCERLVIDDITHWARTYKVGHNLDGGPSRCIWMVLYCCLLAGCTVREACKCP